MIPPCERFIEPVDTPLNIFAMRLPPLIVLDPVGIFGVPGVELQLQIILHCAVEKVLFDGRIQRYEPSSEKMKGPRLRRLESTLWTRLAVIYRP